METIVRAEKICRRFQSGHEIVEAVKDVSMHVRRAELAVLRGPSGSGKTTLINMLGALDLPSRGTVYFLDADITGFSEPDRDALRRKRMGFVFQSVGLISIMSAYENVELAMRIGGYPESSRKEWAENCLHMVGMYKRRNHLPSELSGGEQQRVAIARAMAHGPDIIFADEPTSALDSVLGLQVVKLFKELVEKRKMTVVMTTHDPCLMEIADSVWTLEGGRIIHGKTND